MRRSSCVWLSPRASVLASLTLAAFCALGALRAPPTLAAGSAQPFVVGGEKAKIEALPFQVALYDPQLDPNPVHSQFCGGVILDATHVLTAAHCVFNEAAGEASSPAEIEVLAGTANLDTTAQLAREFQKDPVAATSFDASWDRLTGEHDLGLLTLAEPLKVGEPNGVSRIASIPLLKEAELTAPAIRAIVSGWGDEHPEPPGTVRPRYATELKSAQLPLVSEEACAHDYETFERNNPGAIAPKPGPDFVCAGGESQDACFGDSGGPLVVGLEGNAPAELRLLGTVDLGEGCGQPGLPGLFQSVMQHENVVFIESKPPQAPLQSSPAVVAGTAQPGHTLTCEQGAWQGSAAFQYQFFADESAFSGAEGRPLPLTPLSPASTYNVPPNLPAGTRIFCAVFARNAGGFAEVFSPDVTLSAGPAPPPPEPQPTPSSSPAPTPTPVPTSTTTTPTSVVATLASTKPAPPTLRVLSTACKRTGCTVQLLAAPGAGLAAVSQVESLLTFLQGYPCHEGRLRFTCTRTVMRRLTARATPAGRFVVAATGLKPGSYVLLLTAVDKAGVRQQTVTRVGLVVKHPHSKR